MTGNLTDSSTDHEQYDSPGVSHDRLDIEIRHLQFRKSSLQNIYFSEAEFKVIKHKVQTRGRQKAEH